MNMIGSNALVMLTQQAEETIAELSKVTSITCENCGRVKDLADNALKLAKDIEENRKLVKAPHDLAAKAVDAAYNPLRDSVTAAARLVKGLVETWVIAEKRKMEAEAAQARAKAEEVAKLAAEADAFLADDDGVAEAETAAAIAESRAMASRQVTSAAGISKVSSLRKVRFAEVKDAVALVTFYANHPDVLGAATTCANAAIRAAKGGPLTIPGIEIVEKEKLV